jgi:thioredoxin-dependent peroxiredoxin
MDTLKEGSKAPDFVLEDENEQEHRLSDFRGKRVVLYFYPKDDSSGCTTEACEFRDDYDAYKEADVVILGVSPDSPKSHKKFKEKYNLPFTLLADESHEVLEAYGVWGTKKMYGKEYMGVFRTTYVIDEDGNIVKVFENVSPKGHSQEILSVFG